MTIIGIDLGTTNSLAAYWEEGEVKLIPNVHGDLLTPSVVGVDDNGECLVGKAARERLLTHPELTVEAFKRRMGSKASVTLGKQVFTPVELSSLVLQNIKGDAEALLGQTVTEAVISVPAYFNDAQRHATKVAGELAGLTVERLINEPTAAAVAYGLHDREEECTFIVVDLGGGTFDVSVMEMFNGVMEVHASAGDTFLGGEDFTEALQVAFLKAAGVAKRDLSSKDLSKVRAAVNRAKHQLTDADGAALAVTTGAGELEWRIDRATMEKLCAEVVQRLRQPIERVLRDSRMRPTDLSDVILVGGATRMPLIRGAISRMFRRLPSCTINPDEVVARGAAIQAALKSRDQALRDVVLTDVCPYTLGIEVAVEKGSAAGYEAGHFMPIIERNTVIPTSRVENIVTIQDKQTELAVKIFQGESRLTLNNILLGELNIKVPKAKAGEESADVRFSYDVNGLLEVEVKIVSSGEIIRKVIEKAPGSLSQGDIRKSLDKLANIKVHPRETAANRAVLAKAERIYEQNLGDVRQYVAHLISEFEQVLDKQDLALAEKARETLVEKLEELEGDLLG
ncbi:molecular chaperone HscC [Exilibacterium tricleocarpae]|uniref:Molecular chaperone HscC n=1 Tax=Exilibacterium tricleocarpae TaxID=2591008 RepID=A0A545T3L8_9GAMM|nr:molecular chaperone HscC [Exilibacterium tricleocarpae]TQV71817.1 molecular chaperone HscC [Exilibacterium tricleocarpae]